MVTEGGLKRSAALTAAIVCADPASAGHLRACLQQTGLVSSVTEWTPGNRGLWTIRPTEMVPEVVILGLHGDLEPYFALAVQLRRIRPTTRIIACSAQPDPDPQLLLQAMRSGVQEFLPPPINAAVLQEALTRFLQENNPVGALPAEKLIVVMGTKGGVGTSTVAVNLAVQMVELTKKRVALLDFAPPMGHACLLLDLRPRFSVRDAVENLEHLDGHFFSGLLVKHKSGLEVLPGVSHPEEWERIQIPSLVRVVNVAQSIFDHVLVDFGSSISLEWAPVLRLAKTILLVAEANVPSLWALERDLSALSGLGRGPERVRIVINRWSRADEEALKAVEKNIKRPIIARLPNDFRQVSEAINLGTPLYRNHNNPLVSQFRLLAGQVSGTSPMVSGERRGLAHLFSITKAPLS